MAFVILLCLSTVTQAQQVIAYVDADAVLKAMPAYRSTRQNLETFQAQLLKELEEEKRSIAKYYTQVIEQVKRGELSAQQQRDAETKLQQLQADLQAKTLQADERLLAREKSLSKPMYDAFEKALQAVAKRYKYTYILDQKLARSVHGGIDATAQLKKQLGI